MSEINYWYENHWISFKKKLLENGFEVKKDYMLLKEKGSSARFTKDTIAIKTFAHGGRVILNIRAERDSPGTMTCNIFFSNESIERFLRVLQECSKKEGPAFLKPIHMIHLSNSPPLLTDKKPELNSNYFNDVFFPTYYKRAVLETDLCRMAQTATQKDGSAFLLACKVLTGQFETAIKLCDHYINEIRENRLLVRPKSHVSFPSVGYIDLEILTRLKHKLIAELSAEEISKKQN